MAWFQENFKEQNTFFSQSIQEGHIWGRQTFAKSYARGGFAATVFAPSRKEMMLNPWRPKYAEGSKKYLSRLEELNKLHPGNKGIEEAISKSKKASKGHFGGGTIGVATTAFFVGSEMYNAKGNAVDKIRAGGRGIMNQVGWEAGSAIGWRTGASIGASIGSAILPGIGTGVGALIGTVGGYIAGGLIGSEAGETVYDAALGRMDKLVNSERDKRGLDWGKHTAAFQTRKAATMRQQSLSLMNRGQMSARSLMGREAVFVHR